MLQNSALICRTINETNRWTRKQEVIIRNYGGFVVFIKVFILIPAKLIVTIAKFLWLIGGERKRGKLNMAMIETVRQRQKNSVDFASCYDNLCALQSSCPLGSITANLDELSIDCNADRIRHSDWNPILNALKINKTLKTVAFRSYWQQTLYPDGGT